MKILMHLASSFNGDALIAYTNGAELGPLYQESLDLIFAGIKIRSLNYSCRGRRYTVSIQNSLSHTDPSCCQHAFITIRCSIPGLNIVKCAPLLYFPIRKAAVYPNDFKY